VEQDERIELIVKRLEIEFDRYYWTVYYLIGLMDYLQKRSELDFRLVSCSLSMRATKGRHGEEKLGEGKPDAVLQNSDDTKGMLLELKSSYPASEQLMKKSLDEDIRQLQIFDGDVTGWKRVDGVMSEYCIIFLPFQEKDSIAAARRLIGMLRRKEVEFVHPFTIWYWEVGPDMKNKEIIKTIPTDLNPEVGWALGGQLHEQGIIQFDLDDLSNKYDRERHIFGREPPCNCAYTLVQIYSVLGRALRKGVDMKIVCTVEEIMNLAERYLPAWIPDDGKKSQLRVQWVRDALETLVQIKMAKKRDEKTYEWIEPKKRKDFKTELLKAIARREAAVDKYGALTSQNEKVEISTLDNFRDQA
jgi:hypothetical protein